MKIGLAQFEFHGGDIRANLDTHIELITLAAENGADALYFPELSLTGYEPSMARQLSFAENDVRLLPFKVLSREKEMIIGVGMPVRTTAGITISMAIFQPDRELQFYYKEILHDDEKTFFAPGKNLPSSAVGNGEVALSICYELSREAHIKKSLRGRESVYLASVAKHQQGVEKAFDTLAKAARKYEVFCMMVNGVGDSEDGLCTGSTAIWNREGRLLGSLNETGTGLLICDTQTKELQTIYTDPLRSS